MQMYMAHALHTNCNKNKPDLNVIRHPFIIHRTEKKIENELLLQISLKLAVLEFNYLLYSAAVHVLVRPPYTFVHDVPKFDYFILSHCRHKYTILGILFPSSILQVLGVIRAPGFNRLPAPGEEVVMSYLPHSEIASQTVMRNQRP